MDLHGATLFHFYNITKYSRTTILYLNQIAKFTLLRSRFYVNNDDDSLSR